MIDSMRREKRKKPGETWFKILNSRNGQTKVPENCLPSPVGEQLG